MNHTILLEGILFALVGKNMLQNNTLPSNWEFSDPIFYQRYENIFPYFDFYNKDDVLYTLKPDFNVNSIASLVPSSDITLLIQHSPCTNGFLSNSCHGDTHCFPLLSDFFIIATTLETTFYTIQFQTLLIIFLLFIILCRLNQRSKENPVYLHSSPDQKISFV